jgi:hypothetical protein
MADMGITRLRRRRSESPPTFLPWVEPDAASRARLAVQLADLDRLASAAPPSAGRVGARDYIRAYREGRTGPEAVAEAVLAGIRDSNEQRSPPLRAIIACDEEDVRRQARASAERWRRGSPLSCLDGVPMAVKDELDQVPYPTTAGTRIFGTAPASADATPVARLRAAGALLVGKANMHEIGLGVTGMNPNTGFCRNPWDPGRVTGGSSSGPGAAVGSGLVPIALGADGGGWVELVSYEKTGGGYTTAVIRGDVAAVKAACEAGQTAGARVGDVVAVHIIARPHASVDMVIPLGRGAEPAKK